MIFSNPRVAVIGLLLVLSGCDLEQPSHLQSPAAGPPMGRPSDGLLRNPRLQAVVDLQVAQDGSALAALLTDADPAIRARAAFALASVVDGGAAGSLLRSLGDSHAAVRRDAAFALGQFDDDTLVPILRSATPARRGIIDMLSLLTDSDNTGRLANNIQGTDAFGRDQRIRRAAGEIADRVGAFLLGHFEEEENRAVRAQLLQSAARIGESRTLGAVLLVSPRGDEDRAAVALALGNLFRRGVRSQEAVGREAEYLGDPVAQVRVHAAYGIANINDPLIWRPQLAGIREVMDGWSLDEPAAQIMVRGIEGSQLIEDHSRIQRYLTGGTDWRTRAKAAEALKGWENRVEERAALFEALSDPSHHVRVSATKGLTNAPPPPIWIVELKDWIAGDHTNDWMVQGYLMKAFMAGGELQYVFDWVNQFPTTEVLPWMLVLDAVDQAGIPPVVDLYARAARSQHRALGVPAARGLVDRWKGSRSIVASHDQFYDALRGAFETGDPERMAIVAPALRDPLFATSRPDIPGDFEPSPDRVLFGPHEVDWEALKALGRYPRLVLDTDRGRIVLTLATEEAPLTVQWMTRFAAEGRFDGVPFHRVEQAFVIQGGALELSDQGGSVLFRMMTEATQIPYVRGTLGMARGDRRNSEGTEFFIAHTMAPHLNSVFTAWGWVSEGLEVVDEIRRYDLIQHAWVVSDPSLPSS